MAIDVKLERDTGARDGRSYDADVVGKTTSGDTVTIRIKDAETGDVTRETVTADGKGNFSFSPSGLDDGRYTIRTVSEDGTTDKLRLRLDTEADGRNPARIEIRETDAGTVRDETDVAFRVGGLDNDASGLVVFTDANGNTVSKIVEGDGHYRVDLSSLDGPVTSELLVNDTSFNHDLGTGDDTIICFMPGTLIATPAGERAVETLKIGDLVRTADGETRPVMWLGRQTVSRSFGDATRILPVRIRAGALGVALPVRDLLVSADHALLIDGVLAQAGALVNGRTILRETDVPATFTYFHVELADHALILAEGVPAETFIDNAERLAFDNWHEHEALYPEGVALIEMALPRAKSLRQVPLAVRERLAARADALLGAAAVAA